jgi:hypothetical protein
MRVKIYLTVDIDPEDYPVPADGDVTEELEEYVYDTFYDIDGAEIISIKTKME